MLRSQKRAKHHKDSPDITCVNGVTTDSKTTTQELAPKVTTTSQTPENAAQLTADAIAEHVDATLLCDTSASMSLLMPQLRDGVKAFLTDYKKLADNRVDGKVAQRQGNDGTGSAPLSGIYVRVVEFNTTSNLVFSGDASILTQETIADVVENITATGMTSLFDTLVKEIVSQSKRVDLRLGVEDKSEGEGKPREGPDVSLSFTVFTDGNDTCSDTHTKSDTKREIEKARGLGTNCVFLAAKQDASKAGSMYGFAAETTLQVGSDPERALNAFLASTASSIRSASSGGSASLTLMERAKSCSSTELKAIVTASASVADNVALFGEGTLCRCNTGVAM
jgi:hypothetical protein